MLLICAYVNSVTCRSAVWARGATQSSPADLRLVKFVAKNGNPNGPLGAMASWAVNLSINGHPGFRGSTSY